MSTIILTVLLLAFASSMAERYNESLVENFLKKLEADNYDKRTPPVGNNGPGSPVKVVITSYILDIEKPIDNSVQGFKAHFYFRQSWNDSRLKHSEDIGLITLRDEKFIWNPDLFFVNENEGSIHQIMHPNKFVQIKPNGQVLYSARLAVDFICLMNLRSYPHDIQTCVIEIESYGFTTNKIDLQWQEGSHLPVSAADEFSHFELNLIEINQTSVTATLSTGTYKRLIINLTFKRRFAFYATKLYVPFIILVIMSSLSLWIKAEEKCLRLCLILVVLFLMLKLSSDINSWIPVSPYTKAIDVWIAFCDSLVFALLLEFIVVAGIVGWKNNTNNDEELLPISKDVDTNSGSLKSPYNKFIRMFDAGNRGRGNRNYLSNRIDWISRIVFPVIFILFNIYYWSVFTSA